MYPIPILGQQVLLADVLGGRTPGLIPFLIAGGGAVAVSLILVRLTTELFKHERIIFSR